MEQRLSMTPLKIGGITIKNRYCAGSVTGRFLLYEQTGGYSPNGIEFEVSHARGGFGLIVTGSNYGDQTVDPFNALNDKPSPLYAPKVSGYSFKTVADRVHKYGSKIFLQLGFGPGRMRNGKSCSALPTLKDPSKTTQVLTREEIKALIDGHAALAKYAKNNGFDGVEIHAHFGYLLDQFEMECTNHRTDEYGGNLENRLRIYKEDIEGIKAACGKDFPVAIRMGAKTYMKSFSEADLTGEHEFGRDIDETVEVCKLLESYGIDMFDLNSGTYESHYYCTNPYYMPKGYNIHLARRVKEAVKVPVFCVGLMDDVEMCEKALAEGAIDGVTICRAAMVDTQYARKVAEGRLDDIRPCIQCCSCEHYNLKAGTPRCSANPAAMREWSYGVPKAAEAKKVAVIGGGIAGLVAAHTAAKAGHSVAIYDKNEKLGGHLVEIGAQSFKGGVAKLNAWYQRELGKMGVEMHTGVNIDAEAAKKLGADVMILAQGSLYPLPDIAGADDAKVFTAPAVMQDTSAIGDTVVVIGGGCVGSEVAYDLASKGKKVTLIDKNGILTDTGLTDDVRHMLGDLLDHCGVKRICGDAVTAVTESGVRAAGKDGEYELTADSIVAATGSVPAKSMYWELAGCGAELYEIGDMTGGRNTILSVSEQAYEIARML